MKKVYLDNGASTQVDPRVLAAMQPYYIEDYGNAAARHAWGRSAKMALERARVVLAQTINASPEEIVFTSGGSESNTMAVVGFLSGMTGKKHIIASSLEHPSVKRGLIHLCQQGICDVSWLSTGSEGLVAVREVEQALRKETVLVVVMHANNVIGTIQPLAEIGSLCKKRKIAFHADCVQSLTREAIDVKALNITTASFSAHKLHGPKGVGALFIKKELQLDVIIHGGLQEHGQRAGTENIPGIVGFAKAVVLAQRGDIRRMTRLRDRLIDGLLCIPGARLNGSREYRLCHNVNISFDRIDRESLLYSLDLDGIAVSAGSACLSSEGNRSRVSEPPPREDSFAAEGLRLTLSRMTTEADLDYVLRRVALAVKKLRRLSPLEG